MRTIHKTIGKNYIFFTFLVIVATGYKSGGNNIVITTRKNQQNWWVPLNEGTDNGFKFKHSYKPDDDNVPFDPDAPILATNVDTHFLFRIDSISVKPHSRHISSNYKKNGIPPINGPPTIKLNESKGDQPFKSKHTLPNIFSGSQNQKINTASPFNPSHASESFKGGMCYDSNIIWRQQSPSADEPLLWACNNDRSGFDIDVNAHPIHHEHEYEIWFKNNSNMDEYARNLPRHIQPGATAGTLLTGDTTINLCSEERLIFDPEAHHEITEFRWERKAVAGIQNLARTGTGTIDEVLMNITNEIKTVTYNYTLKINGVSTEGKIFVMVYPTPVLISNLNPSIVCSGTPFFYEASSSISNATFSWNRPEIEGISNASASGTGAIINETLINTTSHNIVVPYTITMNADGCEQSQIVKATIRPTPQIETIEDLEFCAYDQVEGIIPVSNIPATFVWVNSNPAIGLPATGTGPLPAFTANNFSDAPITANITIIPRANGCNGESLIFTITVDPVPAVSPISQVELCVGAEHPGIEFESPTEGTLSFSWSSNIDVGFGLEGSGNIPSFIGKVEGEAIVDVTATDARGCDGPPVSYTVKVNTPPDITVTPETPQICYGGQTTLEATGAEAYEWYPAEGLSSTTGSKVIASPETTTTYTITAIDVYGCYSTKEVTVIVNPLPEIKVVPESPVICQGTSIELSASGAASYMWEPSTSLSAVTGSTVTASPTTTTTYTVTGISADGCSNTTEVTITVETLPELTSSLNPDGICSGSVFSYLPVSETATKYRWNREAIPGGSPENSGEGIVGKDFITDVLYLNAGESTSKEIVYIIDLETPNGCTHQQEIRVQVSPQPQLEGTLPVTICNGDLITFNQPENPDVLITWSRSSIAGISNPARTDQSLPLNEILVNTTTAPVEVEYKFTVNRNGCEQEITQKVTVQPGPQVEASASVAGPACPGQPFNLFSSSPITSTNIILLSEGFENGNINWITENNLKENNSTSADWKIVENSTEDIKPESKFYLSNGSSTKAHLILKTPQIVRNSINSPIYLEFVHYFNRKKNDELAEVQVSADNETWITARIFNNTQGSNNNFKIESIDLFNSIPSNSTKFYVRFIFKAQNGGLWAIDDVKITERVNPTITWTSQPEGFTSSLANPKDIIQSETTTYFVRYEFPEATGFACNGAASITVESINDTEPPVLHNIPEDVEFSCVDCIQEFLNGSFEDPPPGSEGFMDGGGLTNWVYWHQASVPGWQTKSSDNRIELHPSNFEGVQSDDGNQHAELNAEFNSDLFQEFCTVPTTTLHITFSHAKRNKSNNNSDDIMMVLIGDADKDESTYYTENFTAKESGGQWNKHTIVYPVAPGQTNTRFIFRAIQGSESGVNEGNLIDNISVTTLYNSDILPTATDNCDPAPVVTLKEEKIDGKCSSNYELIRTWTATDAAGNKTSATQTVIVGDFEPPVLTITPNNETFECGTEVDYEIEINDNCVAPEDVTVTFLKADTIPGDCAGKYTIVRSWSAEDLCNNVDTFYQHIHFEDTTSPVFDILPPDATLTCTEASDAWPVASDNCTNEPDISYEDDIIVGSCYGELTITRTWTATDDCGNQSMHIQKINTHDESAPVWDTLMDSLDRTISCSDSEGLTAAQALTPIATDDCCLDDLIIYELHKGSFIPSATCSQTGTYTNVWYAIDDCGNRSEPFTQVITVIDDQAPVWKTKLNSLDRTVECDDEAGLTAALNLEPTAIDLCGVNITVHKRSNGEFIPSSACKASGSYTNTWTATDECGNESELFTQVITVVDTKAPAWTTPPGALNVFVACDDDEALAAAQKLEPVPFDNCDSSPIVVKNSGNYIEDSCPQSGTYINTWTVTDECGNIGPEYIQIIIIEDYTPPEIICPQDAYINFGVETSPENTGALIANDNCDGFTEISFTDEIIEGACIGNYTIRRTWVAADLCGNISTCIQNIYVQDLEPPVLTCITLDQKVVANQGLFYVHTGKDWDAKATDNTEMLQLTVQLSGATTSALLSTLDGVLFNEGETYVEWTATDDCGNFATCSFTVVVDASADLEIKKTANKDAATTGEELMYTLEAINHGPAAATEVVITDVTDVFPDAQFSLSPLGPWLSWEGSYTLTNALPTGGSLLLYVKGVVPVDHCETIFNTAGIKSVHQDNYPANNEATAVTPVTDTQPPVIDPPPTIEVCVNMLYMAEYTNLKLQRWLYQNDNPQEPYLIDNEAIEDYYLFTGGSNELDLDLEVLNYRDNCCSLEDGVEITWVITFDAQTPNGVGGTTVSGTGQPSELGSAVKLWGDRINYVPLHHTITYTVQDCNGNTGEEVNRTIIVLPRPQINMNNQINQQ